MIFFLIFFLLKIKTKNRNHQSFALRLHDPTTYGLHSWHSYVVTSFRYSATLLIPFIFMFLTRIKVIYTNTSLYQRHLWEKRAHKCSMDRACRYTCRRSPQEIPLQPTTPANNSSCNAPYILIEKLCQPLKIVSQTMMTSSPTCLTIFTTSRLQTTLRCTWFRSMRFLTVDLFIHTLYVLSI